MQTSRYLVTNRVDLLANDAGYVTEYRPVYSRQLNVYKGIDNVLEFKLLNADQKPLDVDRYTPKFVVFDENQNMIIEHTGINLQVGDSSSYTNKGLFKVTITENDLLNVKEQYLSYSVYLVDYDGTKVITYSNEFFGMNGIIKVSGEAFPGPADTYSVSTFSLANNEYVSEPLDAQPGINGNEALHTAVVYTDQYIGNVIVQATLDNQVTGTTNWADITSLTFDGSESEPTPVNFNGVFSFLRFRATSNPADKISKILVRT